MPNAVVHGFKLIRWFSLLLLFGFPAEAEPRPEMSIGDGQIVHVVNGNTIEMDGDRFRLKGFDAPEIGRRCADRRGRTYDCGAFAAENLTEWFRAKPKPRCTALSDRARARRKRRSNPTAE